MIDAARYGHADCVTILIQNGADINAKNDVSKFIFLSSCYSTHTHTRVDDDKYSNTHTHTRTYTHTYENVKKNDFFYFPILIKFTHTWPFASLMLQPNRSHMFSSSSNHAKSSIF